MSNHPRSGSIDVHLTAGESRPIGTPAQDIPFRILICGDFSGQGYQPNHRTATSLAERRPFRIDRDNVDDVLATLRPAVCTRLFGNDSVSVIIPFTRMGDFHPDSFSSRVELIRQLCDIRRRLTNPSTFQAALSDLATWTQQQPVSDHAPSTAPSGDGQESKKDMPLPDHLLDSVIEEAQASAKSVAQLGPTGWQMFLRSLVEPHLVQKSDPRVPELSEQVDGVLGKIIRGMLHHPAWQALEATWRGLKCLIDRLETDSLLQLYVFDVTKAELAADLCGTHDLTKTHVYQLLVTETIRTPGAEPWAVFGGVYTFDRSETDVALLHQISKIAREAGAPFLAAGFPTIAGCPSLATTADPDEWQEPHTVESDNERWTELRSTPESAAIGLALPRFLLRLPYGTDTEPIETFPFEEFIAPSTHDQSLWGNPVYACLLLLGQAFMADGWQMRPGSIKEIEGLPLHVYRNDYGESATMPCAEAWLTENAVERLLEAGLMPLVSYKDEDRIRLIRFQSLASPPRALTGRWAAF